MNTLYLRNVITEGPDAGYGECVKIETWSTGWSVAEMTQDLPGILVHPSYLENHKVGFLPDDWEMGYEALTVKSGWIETDKETYDLLSELERRKVILPRSSNAEEPNRKFKYFIEDTREQYGKWLCLGEMFDSSKPMEAEQTSWTSDPHKAFDFGSRQAAESHNKNYKNMPDIIVTEHEFVDGKLTTPSTACKEKIREDCDEIVALIDAYFPANEFKEHVRDCVHCLRDAALTHPTQGEDKREEGGTNWDADNHPLYIALQEIVFLFSEYHKAKEIATKAMAKYKYPDLTGPVTLSTTPPNKEGERGGDI